MKEVIAPKAKLEGPQAFIDVDVEDPPSLRDSAASPHAEVAPIPHIPRFHSPIQCAINLKHDPGLQKISEQTGYYPDRISQKYENSTANPGEMKLKSSIFLDRRWRFLRLDGRCQGECKRALPPADGHRLQAWYRRFQNYIPGIRG